MDTNILMNLPKTLRIMLSQLVSNNELLGWNIYCNKYDQLCCNIRFDVVECGHIVSDSLAMQDQTCCFRKVSPKQQARSRGRLDNFKDKYHVSKDNKRRKLDNTSPELPRFDSDKINISSICIDSPEQPVNCQYEHTTPSSQIDPLSPITVSPKSDVTFSGSDSVISVKSIPLEYHPPITESETVSLELESVTQISHPEPLQCDSIVTVPHEASTHNVAVSHIEPTYQSSTLALLPGAECLEYDSTSKSPPNPSRGDSLPSHSKPRCPCCDNIMTVTHECETPNFDLNANDLLSESLTSCEVAYTPPKPVPLNEYHPPDSSTAQSPSHPVADPPHPPGDGKWERFCNDPDYQKEALDKICKTQ